ncbi:MAG: hypothetical protein C4K58_06855 [Flavobacteriaceae bacterium]|nr:MAG: hypothetical protein C4K58_06855 [Flavobacteriaceae bacterium]
MEEFKLKSPQYLKTDTKGLEISRWAHKDDLGDNIAIAKRILKVFSNFRIQIRPHVNLGAKTGYGKKEKSNPEFYINKKVSDLKTLKGGDVNDLFKSAKEQGVINMVLDITNSPISIERAIEQLNGKNSNMLELVTILKKDEVVLYDFKNKKRQ